MCDKNESFLKVENMFMTIKKTYKSRIPVQEHNEFYIKTPKTANCIRLDILKSFNSSRVTVNFITSEKDCIIIHLDVFGTYCVPIENIAIRLWEDKSKNYWLSFDKALTMTSTIISKDESDAKKVMDLLFSKITKLYELEIQETCAHRYCEIKLFTCEKQNMIMFVFPEKGLYIVPAKKINAQPIFVNKYDFKFKLEKDLYTPVFIESEFEGWKSEYFIKFFQESVMGTVLRIVYKVQ